MKNSHPFDMLNFVLKKSQLTWLYHSMELALKNYKHDKNEPQKKIDVVKDHLIFISQLQNEWEITNRINTDYLNQNLILMYKFEQLSKKNKELEKEIRILKESFKNGLK